MSQPEHQRAEDVKSILFVELLGGIGDILIALPAIQALSHSHPQARLTVFTFAPGSELLQTDPLIHQVIAAARHQPQLSLAQLLENHVFDLMISDTNYDGIDQLIEQSGTPRTLTNLWRSRSVSSGELPPDDQFVSDRFLEILLAEGLIEPRAILAPRLHLADWERQRSQQTLANLARPLIGLIPDAGMAIKRWPVRNFVELGQTLQHDYGASILVPVGSDQTQAEQIVAGMGAAAHLWPRRSLRELAAVLACTDLVVAADTGVARIAAALDVPTITLFGPSWHGRYGQPSPHVNLQGYRECPERVIANFTKQRCWYGGVCPFAQWQTCLEAISPIDVLAAAAPYLTLEASGDER